MRWISFTVLAATLVILASLSVAVAVPARTTSGAAPRALKQYKMKRPGIDVKKRDVLDKRDEERQDNDQHRHPKPSHHWYPTTTQYWWKETETFI